MRGARQISLILAIVLGLVAGVYSIVLGINKADVWQFSRGIGLVFFVIVIGPERLRNALRTP
ncbi:MAG: hypothetical protein ACO1SX_02640 [Actinomycetota bacterium]